MKRWPRWMLDELQVLLQEEPAIMISGPRASGKTTLLREIQTLVGGTVIDLADDDVLSTVGLDPAGYLHGLPRPLLIDEYQRLPKILGVVKRLIDDDGQPGDVVLTGSATGAILQRGTETLAGRVHEMTLWGLSQGELSGVREHFVDAAFDNSNGFVQHGLRTEIRSDYVAAVARGGFPKALEREREVARRRWLTDYVSRVIDRDLPALVSLRNPQLLGRLLRTSASRTGQVTNMAEVAQTLGTSPATVATYIDLLDACSWWNGCPHSLGISRSESRSTRSCISPTLVWRRHSQIWIRHPWVDIRSLAPCWRRLSCRNSASRSHGPVPRSPCLISAIVTAMRLTSFSRTRPGGLSRSK